MIIINCFCTSPKKHVHIYELRNVNKLIKKAEIIERLYNVGLMFSGGLGKNY